MLDRFTSDLRPFLDEAMAINMDATKTIHQVEKQYERLIAAVALHERTKLLDTLHARGIVPKDRDLLQP